MEVWPFLFSMSSGYEKKAFAHRTNQRIFTLASSEVQSGGLAQLARALAWHARGHRFDSDILHQRLNDGVPQGAPFFVGCYSPSIRRR